MGKTLFLHIGYPKTGATALQRNIFPRLRDCGFFYAGYNEQQNHLAASEFGRMVHGVLQKNSPTWQLEQNALISCEGVIADCCKYFSDNGSFLPRPINGLAEKTLGAAQSYGADEVRVIIVLRRQGELSHSLYAQSYTHYFSRVPELRSYRDYATRIIEGDSIAAAYDYASVVGNYLDIFGRDHVLVLFYEDLVSDQHEFLEQLAAFTGCKLPGMLSAENVRLIGNSARAAQPASLLDVLDALKQRFAPNARPGIGKYLRFLHHVPARKAKLIARQPDLEQQVLESCRDSNIRLAEITGRNLSALGYF